MEIRNLTTFIKVAEQGSFTKAADALDYSQSTVSFQIKQIEDELGGLIFERINRTLTLTELGSGLLEYAKSVTRLTDEFIQGSSKESSPKGYLHVLTPDSICEDMMNTNYVDFHTRYPDIALKFTNGDTEAMFRMLSRNEGDVMVTLDTHTYRSEYIIAKEEPIKMHFVTGASSPYASLGTLKPEQLSALPFILTEKNIAYRRALDNRLAASSIELQPILEIGRTDIITNMLEAGVGVSFLPDFVTEKKEKEGKLRYLTVEDMNIVIWKQLIYHKNKWRNRALMALIDYICENEFSS